MWYRYFKSLFIYMVISPSLDFRLQSDCCYIGTLLPGSQYHWAGYGQWLWEWYWNTPVGSEAWTLQIKYSDNWYVTTPRVFVPANGLPVAGTSFAIRGKLRNFNVPSSSEITIPLKTIDHKYNISIMILVITEGKRSVACAYKQKCDQDVGKQLLICHSLMLLPNSDQVLYAYMDSLCLIRCFSR